MRGLQPRAARLGRPSVLSRLGAARTRARVACAPGDRCAARKAAIASCSLDNRCSAALRTLVASAHLHASSAGGFATSTWLSENMGGLISAQFKPGNAKKARAPCACRHPSLAGSVSRLRNAAQSITDIFLAADETLLAPQGFLVRCSCCCCTLALHAC